MKRWTHNVWFRICHLQQKKMLPSSKTPGKLCCGLTTQMLLQEMRGVNSFYMSVHQLFFQGHYCPMAKTEKFAGWSVDWLAVQLVIIQLVSLPSLGCKVSWSAGKVSVSHSSITNCSCNFKISSKLQKLNCYPRLIAYPKPKLIEAAYGLKCRMDYMPAGLHSKVQSLTYDQHHQNVAWRSL